MKRGLAITIICFSLIFVFSLSFVSAGFFSDIWSRITGAQVVEEPTPEPECANEGDCTPTEKIYCEDSNACSSITNYVCMDGKCVAAAGESKCEPCPYGCSDGVCLSEPIINVTECTDSDGGLDYYASGSACTAGVCTLDGCHSDGSLTEAYCEGNNVKTERFVCPYGCSDGACIRKEGLEPVPEVSPTEVIRICAAKIRVTLDREIYYYGDDFKLVVEIFDSQGNHIPYYSFYTQIYTYHDGIWHTPEEDKTDKDGYVIEKGKIEEGQQALGKVKIKVYTKVYANCDSVEDSITAEVRKGQREEVCGIGTCVPEEVKGVEEIPEDKKMLYSCMGCKLDGKCYPMGYRKEGRYCSEIYEFVEQREEEVCDNNFECKSNVCVSGECVGEDLIKKILNWFRKLFGAEGEEEEPKEKQCSKLLIEKDIGDYEYFESGYGDSKEAQVQIYSKDGEQIGVVKCCMARYVAKEENEGGAIVCPFDNREDIENSLKWLSARGEISLSEYNGQNVIRDADRVVAWVQNNYVISVGGDHNKGTPFSEDIADAYLKKYPSDLEGVEIPEESFPEYHDPVKVFLDDIKNLGTTTLIDFETLPDGTVLENGDKLTGKEWEGLGAIFEFPSEDYLQVFGPKYPFNPVDKLSLSPGLGPFEAGGDTHDDLNIIFTESVKAAGIYLLDLGETDERESITFLDENNNVIEKISPWPKSTFGNPAPGTFVGLIHEDGISKIEILENTQDGDDIAYDNLYFVK